ncbi:MAG: 30S ribosomal protein S13 [Planctomycetes bacterium]|nr:30S ribosomal protein S13 [Planctomycetota bacterium]
MPRILGVDVPNDKRIVIALTYIYGIGDVTSHEILKATDIDESVRGKDLTEDELSRLGSHIEKNYIIEGQLRRQEAQNVNRLREIKCYRGIRHRLGLPVRGQRTKTNARTRKGPRKTVAGKKGVKDVSRG